VTHGKLKERDARRIFRQVVEAIDYCHEVHVIRTLTPETLDRTLCLIFPMLDALVWAVRALGEHASKFKRLRDRSNSDPTPLYP
jgi:hypothetical protein